MNNYEFIEFRKSTNPNKKYDAFLKHKKTGKIKIVKFGSSFNKHYFDSTGIGAWSHLNHYDDKRRDLYRKRAGAKGFQLRKFSPAWFSWNFLW